MSKLRTLTNGRITRICGLLAFAIAAILFAVASFRGADPWLDNAMPLHTTQLPLMSLGGMFCALGGIAILLSQMYANRAYIHKMKAEAAASKREIIANDTARAHELQKVQQQTEVNTIHAIENAQREVLLESKRVTDKFTQKAITAQHSELEQLSCALAAELRLIREESLAASESRLAIYHELAEIRAALAGAKRN